MNTTPIPHYTVEQLCDVLRTLGMNVFTKGDLNLNIVGIRNGIRESDLFDDLYCIFAKTDGKWFIRYFPCTTDPGRIELTDPSFAEAKARGTGILVHDHQFNGAWKLGRHGDWVPGWGHVALEQCQPVPAFRDNNRDTLLDFNPASVQTGNWGCDHHAASLWQTLDHVGRYSAMCQVLQNPADHRSCVDMWQRAAALWGPIFTYTLLHQPTVDAHLN